MITSDSLDYKNGKILVGNYLNKDHLQEWDIKSCKLIETFDIGEGDNSKSYSYAAGYSHRSEHDLMAVALSGSNKVKILKDRKLACEI